MMMSGCRADFILIYHKYPDILKNVTCKAYLTSTPIIQCSLRQSSGPDNVGTVTSTTKTNSYSSYLVSLFNDIELDSFTIFTLSGDDVITLDAKNDYALAYFYTGSGDDVIRIINEVGTGTYGRIINLWASGRFW